MNVKDLSNIEFHKLANKQKELFPDLLLLRSEQEIVQDFYEYYERKYNQSLDK